MRNSSNGLDLIVRDVTTGHERTYRHPDIGVVSPRWLPDGSGVIVLVNPQGVGGRRAAFYLADVQTGNFRRLLDKDANGRVRSGVGSVSHKWNNFLGTTGLDKYRGQILPRNALDAPWLHTLDFHYDVTLPISVVNVQLSFEILNLINLIDGNHGLVRYVQNQTYTPLNYSGIDSATGKPIYTVNSTSALNEGIQYTTNDLRSRYQLKWGARLSF